MNDLKAYIDNKLSDITVSSELEKKILQQTKGREKRKKTGIKGAVAAAVLCLCLTCSATVLAASVPSVNDWLYRLSPQFAQFLYPIQKSSESQGIRLQVLSATNDDHNTVVYFSIQDMEGKGRVSENLDLCDSESIEGPSIFGTEIIAYDEKTNTAYFEMHGSGGRDMSNQMATFSISSLMSNKVEYDWYNTKINLPSLLNGEAETIPLSEVEFQGGSVELQEDSAKILKPDVMDISLGGDVDFVTISNIGFVEGKLHIQTKWAKSFDNHGDLILLDEKNITGDVAMGNSKYGDTLYFMTKEDEESRSVSAAMNPEAQKHIEYIYDVGSIEELEGYDLWGWFVKDGIFTNGSWKVNFRMADVENDSLIIKDLKGIGECAEISPLGIYIEGYCGNPDEAEITIQLKNGNVLECCQFSTDISRDGSNYNLYTAFGEELNTGEIKSILLDNKSIYEND